MRRISTAAAVVVLGACVEPRQHAITADAAGGDIGVNDIAAADTDTGDAVADAADGAPASCAGRTLGGIGYGANNFACAIRCDGAVWCWGNNQWGQLGDGTMVARSTPVPVRGLGGAATALALGFSHACAVVGGSVRCWGQNSSGQLGDGIRTDRATAAAVSGLTGTVVGVAAGGLHSCAVLDSGAVWCWGSDGRGQLGDGASIDRVSPVAVAGLAGPVAAVVAGQYHTCARLRDGSVACWGFNGFGVIGDGTMTDRPNPTTVSLVAGAIDIASTQNHVCAALTTGDLWCWGFNGDGAIASDLSDRLVPTEVPGFGAAVRSVATGGRHSCAMLASGGVRCLGGNAAGQLGDGSMVQRLVPTDVTSLGASPLALCAGTGTTCVALVDGRARCWGSNSDGQLGDGRTADSNVPQTVLLPP